MPVGAKATGSSIGLAGAAAYAPELTIVTKHWMGYPVDPATLETAVTKLTEAAWGGVLIAGGLLGGLVAAYIWREAQERFGEQSETSVTVTATQPPPTVTVTPTPATPPAVG